jgi:hypothetical protein
MTWDQEDCTERSRDVPGHPVTHHGSSEHISYPHTCPYLEDHCSDSRSGMVLLQSVPRQLCYARSAAASKPCCRITVPSAREVLAMDHQCLLVNNCVGYRVTTRSLYISSCSISASAAHTRCAFQPLLSASLLRATSGVAHLFREPFHTSTGHVRHLDSWPYPCIGAASYFYLFLFYLCIGCSYAVRPSTAPVTPSVVSCE